MSAATAQTNGHAGSSSDVPVVTANKIQPNDVGWQFVPQYYNFMNKQPHRLHCFYNKRSTFIHGEEGEEAQVALGQQEIHDRIAAIGYDQCKVYIHSIDSQSSANGGIIILVIGEMSNANQPWRKFTQTFFLAEQPNGYFVLNDIFRYLKEESDEEEEEAELPTEDEVVPAPAAPVAEPEIAAGVEEETKVVEAAQPHPAPEPEPVTAPAHPDTSAVPEEAVIASVPDKDVSPADEAPAVEEPTTATNPPIEEAAETKPEVPSSAPSSTPAPVLPNGTPAPAISAPAAAPAPAPAPVPAKPAAPKTWASLAAAARPSAIPSAPAVTVAATPAVKKEAAAAPAPAAAAPAAAAPPAAPASGTPRHPFYENASKVQTPQCFVKLPNWSPDAQGGAESMDEATLRQVASRFGEVAKVEIVKSKACAFVEFANVQSARKAIIASLSTAQGGEGGVKVGTEGGKLNFETRKEKDERRPKGGARGGAPERGGARGGARVGGGGREEFANGGERGSAAGRGRGRGRGGPAGGAGERGPAAK